MKMRTWKLKTQHHLQSWKKNSTLGVNVRKIFHAENYKMLVKEIENKKVINNCVHGQDSTK